MKYRFPLLLKTLKNQQNPFSVTYVLHPTRKLQSNRHGPRPGRPQRSVILSTGGHVWSLVPSPGYMA